MLKTIRALSCAAWLCGLPLANVGAGTVGDAPASAGGVAAAADGAAATAGDAATAKSAAGTTAGQATEAAACRTVRFSDIGWTDVTSTTGLVSRLLRELGYEPQVTVLSLPVTYASMKNRDIDVFLGNWMPAQDGDRKPFVADGSVEVVRANLTGARYTLAVPAYLPAGLRDFEDIQRFGEQLGWSIYGIEPGNDGNRHVLGMIKDNRYGLGRFKLIESSEQGMLAEVERSVRKKAPIVFLAWDPHPMNMRFDLRYLTGGDATFGPNFGGAAVYTNVRAGYLRECPNVARLLRNLEFTTHAESELMADILDKRATPEEAGAKWMKSHPAVVAGWLAGVTTFDGRPAAAASAAGGVRASGQGRFETWVTSRKIPVGDAVTVGIEWIKTHGTALFDGVSALVRGSVDGVTALLTAVPAVLLIAAFAAFALFLRRSWPLALFVAAALLFIMNQGYWLATLETLSLVTVAALVSAAIGVPVGIAAAHRPRLFTALRPVLDLMQTLPTFVYLIPTLVLFGLGVVPGLISTVIFALPAPIRLTHLGISSVPKSLIEAGEAFGATRLQMLLKIELPSAAPTIVAGITQCIMLSLSMVVIAALVGAGGLGVPVVRALNTVQIGMGFEAGIAIVLLAVILDRISRPAEPGGRQ